MLARKAYLGKESVDRQGWQRPHTNPIVNVDDMDGELLLLELGGRAS